MSGISKIANLAVNKTYLLDSVKQTKQTLRPSRLDYSSNPDKKTICLVPGFSCSVSTYENLIQHLIEDYNVIPPETFPQRFKALLNVKGIETQAITLLNMLDQMNIDSIDYFIGHSNGGLVALNAIALAQEGRHKIAKTLGNVVTLSSPLNGSKDIAAIAPVPAIRDLRPDSAVVRRAQSQKENIITSFVTEKDALFSPEEQYLPNSETEMVNHGHMDYFVGAPELVSEAAEKIKIIL